MSKGFALTLCKKFLDLREHCKWQVEVNDRDGSTTNQNVLLYIAPNLGHQFFSLLTKKNKIVNRQLKVLQPHYSNIAIYF